MKVQLYTETLSAGVAVRVAGAFRSAISFRKMRGTSRKEAAEYGGDAYILTSAKDFQTGQIFKYGAQYYRIKSQLNSLAYLYQYIAEVAN